MTDSSLFKPIMTEPVLDNLQAVQERKPKTKPYKVDPHTHTIKNGICFICGKAEERKEKRSVGRPCEACKRMDEIINKTKEFLDNCRVKTESGRTRHVNIPYIEELALELDVDDETIGLWASKKNEKDELEHPQFSATIKRLKTMQKMMLLKHTLGKTPAGSIFQLKANHGMMESEKQILAGDKDQPMKYEIEIVEDDKFKEDAS